MLISGIATTIAVILGAWFAIAKFIGPFFKRVNKWTSTWEQFMEDWAGTPERPGRSAVPGVMERLNNIDGELKKNGGKSVKDVVNRIEKRLVDGDKKFDELYARLENTEKKAK
jgi:hypothetical protein